MNKKPVEEKKDNQSSSNKKSEFSDIEYSNEEVPRRPKSNKQKTSKKEEEKRKKRNLGENVCACDTTNWKCSKCKQYTCDFCCAIGENGDTTAEDGSQRVCMECGVLSSKRNRKPTNYKDHVMW